jgi:predicted RNA-binding protein with PIN domain
MEEWLVVDAYNIIRANPNYSDELDIARTELIHDLIEYQAVSGQKVYVVFDAYRIAGIRSDDPERRITVVYTNKEETADTWIEQFVRKAKDPKRQIYVATSDYLEQRMIFGQGAYRMSARELLDRLEQSKARIVNRLRHQNSAKTAKNPLWEQIPDALKQKMEKWRRKK